MPKAAINCLCTSSPATGVSRDFPAKLPRLPLLERSMLMGSISRYDKTEEQPVKMTSLLSLCDELLHEVFSLVNPTDLAMLAKTCRTFNAYIKGNKILWKDVFLMNFVSVLVHVNLTSIG
jgi:hypothetical protein